MLYLGNLDDVVTRYPWTGRRGALDFNQTLLDNLLFGQPAYINDGYIVQSRQALEGIRRPGTDSLLETLIEFEHVKVLCRTRPSEMPKAMAKGGVKSHASLANDRNTIRDLEALSQRLDRNNNFHKWPPYDVSQGFYRLVLLVKKAPEHLFWFDALPHAFFKRICNGFVTLFEANPTAARTQWEDVSQEVCKAINDPDDREIAHLESMNFANEVYHFNFAGILSMHEQTSVHVNTRLNTLFLWALNRNLPTNTESEEFIAEQGPLEMPAMPWSTMKIDLSDGNAVAKPFLTPGREEYDARIGFLEARDAYFNDANQATHGALLDASARYNSVLSSLFGLSRSTGEIVMGTLTDPMLKVLEGMQEENYVEWLSDIQQVIPDEGVATLARTVVELGPYVNASLGYYAPNFKRTLRRVGKIHGEAFVYEDRSEFMNQMRTEAKKSRDTMIDMPMSNERSKIVFGTIDKFET